MLAMRVSIGPENLIRHLLGSEPPLTREPFVKRSFSNATQGGQAQGVEARRRRQVAGGGGRGRARAVPRNLGRQSHGQQHEHRDRHEFDTAGAGLALPELQARHRFFR